jgi:hypothetical protein
MMDDGPELNVLDEVKCYSVTTPILIDVPSGLEARMFVPEMS